MKCSTKWGLISGVSAGIWAVILLILDLYGISPGALGMIPTWIFFGVGIYLAILQTRVNETEGFISFSVAFRAGLQCAAISALVWNVCYFIFHIFLNRDQLHILYPHDSELQLIARKSISSIIPSFIIATVLTILIGSVVSLVFSFILKKEPEQEQPMP
jgi:hypothetical protein